MVDKPVTTVIALSRMDCLTCAIFQTHILNCIVLGIKIVTPILRTIVCIAGLASMAGMAAKGLVLDLDLLTWVLGAIA